MNRSAQIRWVANRWPELTTGELARLTRTSDTLVKQARRAVHPTESPERPPQLPPEVVDGAELETVRAAARPPRRTDTASAGVRWAANRWPELTDGQIARLLDASPALVSKARAAAGPESSTPPAGAPAEGTPLRDVLARCAQRRAGVASKAAAIRWAKKQRPDLAPETIAKLLSTSTTNVRAALRCAGPVLPDHLVTAGLRRAVMSARTIQHPRGLRTVSDAARALGISEQAFSLRVADALLAHCGGDVAGYAADHGTTVDRLAAEARDQAIEQAMSNSQKSG